MSDWPECKGCNGAGMMHCIHGHPVLCSVSHPMPVETILEIFRDPSVDPPLNQPVSPDMTTPTPPDVLALINEMNDTYAAVDRELREYSRLANELPAHRMHEAQVHRVEADRLTGVAHEIQDKIMARLGAGPV